LTGTVNPGGAATDWWFEYGTSTSYGSKTATTTTGSGSSNIAVNASLTGLSVATTYHYRLVAKNGSGTSNGADGVFTTASPPVVVTTAATGVGPTTATLGGTVNPNGQATSWFLDAGLRWEMGQGWTLGGSLRKGWTMADVRGGLSGNGSIRTNAFAGDIGKTGIFGRFDSFGLRLAQPLRVASGGIDLRLPTNYDYDTLSVSEWTTQRLNLAPTGREIDLEARYGLPLWGGGLQTNLFWRKDPGNYADLSDDVGGALRWSTEF